MVRLGRILRDYQDAGSVNSLLAPWGFVDDTTFLTKAGHVGVVYRLKGVDYEGLTHAQRRTVAHRVEAALRMLDERCRVYQHFIKRTIEPVAATPCAQDCERPCVGSRAAHVLDIPLAHRPSETRRGSSGSAVHHGGTLAGRPRSSAAGGLR